MRELFSDPDPSKVGFYKSVLDEAGILCFIQNENASRGEVLAPIFYPRLCITDDDRYDEALALLKEVHSPATAEGSDWICANCHESVPASFDSCWNCEALKPDSLPS